MSKEMSSSRKSSIAKSRKDKSEQTDTLSVITLRKEKRVGFSDSSNKSDCSASFSKYSETTINGSFSRASFPIIARRILDKSRGATLSSSSGKSRPSLLQQATGKPRFGEYNNLLRKMRATEQLYRTVGELQAVIRFRGSDYKLASSHRLEPQPDARFQVWLVECVVRDIVHHHLSHYRYDGLSGGGATLALAHQVNQEIKSLEFPRYRLVSVVTMGQKSSLSLTLSSRCLWSSSSDARACVTYEQPGYFVTVLVFGLYKD